MQTSKLFSLDEVAETIGYKRTTLHQWLSRYHRGGPERKKLHAEAKALCGSMNKVGGLWKIRDQDLKAWLRRWGPKGHKVDSTGHKSAAKVVQSLEDLAPRIGDLGQPEWSKILELIAVLVEQELSADGGPLKTAPASPKSEG